MILPVPLLPQQQPWNPPSASGIPPTSSGSPSLPINHFIRQIAHPPFVGDIPLLCSRVGCHRHVHIPPNDTLFNFGSSQWRTRFVIRWNRRGAAQRDSRVYSRLWESHEAFSVPLIAADSNTASVITHSYNRADWYTHQWNTSETAHTTRMHAYRSVSWILDDFPQYQKLKLNLPTAELCEWNNDKLPWNSSGLNVPKRGNISAEVKDNTTKKMWHTLFLCLWRGEIHFLNKAN